MVSGVSNNGNSGFALLGTGSGYTSSGGVIIATGQANGGKAGDILVDVGYSSRSGGIIRIGNSDNTNANVGNALNVALGNNTQGSKVTSYGSLLGYGSSTGTTGVTNTTTPGTNTTTVNFYLDVQISMLVM
jgi:hypothetical protein